RVRLAGKIRRVGGHDRRDRALGFAAAAEREQAERPVLLDRLAVHGRRGAVGGTDVVEHGERLVVARGGVEIARRGDNVPAWNLPKRRVREGGQQQLANESSCCYRNGSYSCFLLLHVHSTTSRGLQCHRDG